MEDNNNLLQESNIDGSYQLRLKVKYLQQDKQKLQISNKQMKENIRLLRQINKQLAKNGINMQQDGILKKLTQQNNKLEGSYLRILEQNNELTCHHLMLQQIIQESQNEHRQILKGYENKIIQLRRSIQFKQSCIQTYEQTCPNNNNFEVGNIPPSNLSMVFFNQIDEYKSTIKELQYKVKQLQSQLIIIKDKNIRLQEQRNIIDNLLQSRCGFNQLKQRLNQQINSKIQKCKSQQKINNLKINTLLLNNNYNKQLIKLNHNKKSLKSFNNDKTFNNNKNQKQTMLSTQTHETRQISYQCTSGNYKLNQLKDQLKKNNIQYNKLKLMYKKQSNRRKQNDQKIRILLNSNRFYKQRRQSNSDELNYFKRQTLDLLKIIQKRKPKRSYSIDKSQIQILINNIKIPHQIEILQNNKKYWKKVQFQLKIKLQSKTKTDLQFINRTKHKKSLSDILDYTQLCHDDDKIDKYYNNDNYNKNINHVNKIHKNNTINKNNKYNENNYFKQEQYQNTDNINDFSRILGLGTHGQVFDDQTLIIKPKTMSYAQRKKTKTRSKLSDAHNLTIIRQNVL